MDIRIEGSANFSQVKAQFLALQQQVSRLNAELAQTGIAQQGVNPQGYAQMQRAMRASSQTFRDAANSSGRFYAEQIRVNSATEHYTKLLDKQKLSVRDIYRNRDIMRKAYREQVALQNAYVREAPSMSKGGKGAYDIVVPRQVSAELNTINSRLSWTKALIESASTQMVNWGKNTQWAGRQLMVGFTIPVAAFGAATAVLAYQTDKEMTRIQKVYDTTTKAVAGNAASMAAVNKELAQVEAQSWATATTAAREYGVAVTDTLSVQASLASTGLTGTRLQDATKETLRIATLGELDYQQATETTIALQTAFRLSTEELTKSFNFMNATENATSLTIQDIAEAVPRAASAMSALGVTVEQMTTMLVSMRESGVDPAEAANALKSATGTILAPSPAADEFIKQISDGTVQVTELAKASGGNLYLAMQSLFEQMNGLSKLQKQQILVKLFGKYQFNRVSAMLYNMGDAFNDVENQTHKSMELMGTSSKELADTAELELGRIQESVSGKFKIALESLKGELAQMGEPFLKVGTMALKAAASFAKLFNSMPGWMKHTAAAGAILMALVGPFTMLVGLGANFLGTVIKFITAVVLFGNKMGIVTKESKAMELASKAAAAGFMYEASAVSELTRQLQILSNAQSAATLHARGIMGPQLPPQSIARQQQVTNALGTFQGVFASAFPDQASDDAKEYAKTQKQVAVDAEKEAKSRKRAHNFLAGGVASIAVMATAGTAMAVSNNEFVNKFAQFAMLATFVVPAIKGMGTGFGIAYKNAAKLTTTLWAASAAQGATASRMGKMTSGAKAAAAGFASMMGPVGWIALAVTAIGVGVFAWREHQKKIYEEQVKTQEALSNSTENWATAANKVVREFKRIQQATEFNSPEYQTQLEKSRAVYESDDEGMTNLREALDGLDGNERDLFLQEKYIDLQNRLGLSAHEAALEIQAMMLAAGHGASEAEEEASHLLETIGKFTRKDLNIAVDARLQMINDDNKDTLKTSAEDFAKVWGEAFQRSKSPEEAQVLMDKLLNVSQEGLSKIRNILTQEGQKEFDAAGFKSIEAFYQAIENGTLKLGETDKLTVLREDTGLGEIESQLVNAISRSQDLGVTFKSIDELLNHIVILSRSFTLDEAQSAASEIFMKTQQTAANIGDGHLGMQMFGDAAKSAADDIALQNLNEIALNQGIKQGKTLTEQIRYIMQNVRGETAGAADEAGRMGNNLKGIPKYLSVAYTFDGDQGVNIIKDAMGNLQAQMASTAADNFDNRMQNAIDAAQSDWDNKIDTQQRAQEDAMDRFDARWERRRENVENYYDKRIEKINDAIKAEEKAEQIRQRIFDAEMARLDRLSQMANQNIDFNVALNSGNLDEAAKIRNDAEAQYAQWALEDAAGATGSRSDRKIDKLNNQTESLEEQRDNALKALEKREEDERKHLERLQDIRSKALKDQADADMDARKEAWDLDKQSYDARLDLFKSWTGRSIEDLERWMKKTGFAYEDFGDSRLKPMGKEWSEFFRDQLYKEIRNAGHKVANDNMWKNMATKGRDAVLDAFGFGNLAQLSKFVRTGKMPTKEEVKAARDARRHTPRNKNTGGGRPHDTGFGPQDNHGGGRIGDGGTGRRGVARTQKSLHPSERLVRARDDEFMVNERSYKANSGLVEAINSANGVYHGPENGIMGGLGPAALNSAIMGTMFVAGIKKAISNAVRNPASPTGVGAATGDYAIKPGRGGRHRPVSIGTPGGLHDTSTDFPGVDLAVPIGTPIYAVGDGTITSSYDIRGSEPRRITNGRHTEDGYRSYGRVMVLKLDSGPSVLYGHLSKRGGTGRVKGGAEIGKTGNTGYVISASGNGAHLHFGAQGASPLAFMKNGGFTKNDGLAYLHKAETVVPEGLSKKFHEGVETFSQGPSKMTSELIQAMVGAFNSGAIGSMWDNAWGKKTIGKPSNTAEGDGQVKTGTYNVLFSTSNDATKGDLTNLMSRADVLSLTEMSGQKNKLHDWIKKQGWGVTGEGDAEVIWNMAKYQALKTGSKALNTITGSTPASKRRSAAYALLRDRQTGQKFWQVAAHTLGQLKAGPKGPSIRRQQWSNLDELYSTLSSTAPVLMGGDFNTDLRRGNIPISGARSNWFGNMNGQYTIKSSYFDHILSGLGTKLLGQQVVRGSSDHNALLAQYNIPSLAKGGKLKWDNTLVNGHQGERMLDAENTKYLDQGLRKFANGSGAVYNLNMYAHEGMSEDQLVKATFREIDRREGRKPRSRS